ncbi:Transaldolase [Hypsizygus marmoreus]|uniref:Transaldolase n=1 Tax=Hypsizygus marmoreus TaxID=39966 RepID=A0A369JE33_HYPMA|nr:Transaldolase [Hypsizygus marmoreus]
MSLLSQLRAVTTIDIDSMDPGIALHHGPFHDMTSNQGIVYFQAVDPVNASVIDEAIQYVRETDSNDLSRDSDQFLQDVVDVITVLLAREVYPHLEGRVHAQTSPSYASSTEYTIAHAKRLVDLFDAHGILKSRVCIKIPATPASIPACEALHDEGISTLATCVFSVAQSVAAAHAGCTYVAPYFNELRVHFDPSTWIEYSDTAGAHPMIPVIRSIIASLSGSKTLVMPASIVSVPEVLALAALRPNHLTLSAPLLTKLDALPAILEEQLRLAEPHTTEPTLFNIISVLTFDTSSRADAILLYAPSRRSLEDAFAADAELTRKVSDALAIFGECERETREFVRGVLAAERMRNT